MLCFSYVLGRNTSAGVWTLCAHRRLPLEFLFSCSGPRYLVIFLFWVPRTLVSNMSAGVLDSLVAHRRPRGLVSAFFGGLPDVWMLMFLSPWVFLGAYAFTFCGFGVVQSLTKADTNLGVYVLERQIRDFATTGSLRSASPQCGSLGPRTTDLGTTVLKKYYRVSMFSHKISMDLHGCSSMCHIFSLISYGF